MRQQQVPPLASQYSEQKFWDKIKHNSRKLGGELLEKALLLYYVLQKPSLPIWVRGTIMGALAYLVLPFDTISDFIPVVGYSDDLSLILAAVASVGFYIDDEVRAKATATANRWMGMSLDPKISEEEYIVDPPVVKE